MTNEQIQKMVELGGNEWKAGEKHRVYFDRETLHRLAGLEIELYNTGNVSSAKLNGKKISNSRANHLMMDKFGKFWFDVISGNFQYQQAPIETCKMAKAKILEIINAE